MFTAHRWRAATVELSAQFFFGYSLAGRDRVRRARRFRRAQEAGLPISTPRPASGPPPALAPSRVAAACSLFRALFGVCLACALDECMYAMAIAHICLTRSRPHAICFGCSLCQFACIVCFRLFERGSLTAQTHVRCHQEASRKRSWRAVCPPGHHISATAHHQGW